MTYPELWGQGLEAERVGGVFGLRGLRHPITTRGGAVKARAAAKRSSWAPICADKTHLCSARQASRHQESGKE